MLQDLWNQVATAAAEGKSLEEILKNDPSKKYDQGNMGAYMVEMIYEELGK